MELRNLKLSYVNNKVQILEDLRNEARTLFNKVGHFITDRLTYEGYKADIEEIEDVEEMERLIAELDDEEVKGLIREEEERYAYRNYQEDDYGEGYFSKV